MARQTFLAVVVSSAIAAVIGSLFLWKGNKTAVTPTSLRPKTNVFMVESSHPVALKKKRDLEAAREIATLFVVTTESQKSLLASDPTALKRFESLLEMDQGHLATELWKFYSFVKYGGGLFLDVDSPLLVPVEELLSQNYNLAIVSDYFQDMIHGSMMLVKSNSAISMAERIVKLLVETPIQTLTTSPLLLPEALHKEIKKMDHGQGWYLYQHHCIMDPMLEKGRKLSVFQVDSGNRLSHHCPTETGYCCQVQDSFSHETILMTKHPIFPYQKFPQSLSKPFGSPDYNVDDLPFLSTISQTAHTRPSDAPITPNFYETLFQNDCLPTDLQCNNCLRDKSGADCKKCKHVCPCYCKTLCNVSVDDKFVAKELVVTPPIYSRDPTRLVPRIVHQTWFEEVSKGKYPNMSRLTESFKQSGWEYKFYTDDVARDILMTHFPKEVLEAYDALRPGAFKADLFRYCVLLIYGGVYADMDVMLESNLDAAISPDVGFMVPVDEPGKLVDKRMCLWNGFIVAAPGHPFLAKAIETVVNNIRNRFTSVDVDATFCPDPELSILHAFDTLFTAGPCILGSVVNKALGRPGQTQFEPGTIQSPRSDVKSTLKLDSKPRIPGRTIILKQNKWDMGAHRFTLLEKNLVVAATDMPDYDDRESLENKEHYSKTHVKAGIYGLEKLYVDNKKSNEDIRISINDGDGNFVSSN
eukprot:CAMPEP_0194206944 /NCGR_PEP_ID=MMETSP0156-20130528/5845_1 /TAXON_ID=33649 /ORGANISM="Thalassionema nitzschioides, Strain L26-B" /LENGTH=696 /DNA_ID=CAMNT_0038933603 /DNA_START=137 /DNA_END=2227 /DNA_ORIENTATION=-